MPLSPRTLRPANNFTPRSISGLALWLDASDASTLFQNSDGTTPATATSDPVGYWADKSGNGRHVTQATSGNRPLVGAVVANGRRGVNFGTTNNSQKLSWVPASGTQDWQEVFAVGVYDTAASTFGDNHALFGGTTSALSDIGWQGEQSTNSLSYAYGTFARRSNINAVDAIDTSLVKPFPAITSPFLVVTRNTNNTLANGFQVGNDRTVANRNWRGRVCEVVAFSRTLTATERSRIARYLASKYGITLAPTVSNADAQDWVNRVYANGGTVSASTAAAVNQFCNDIDYGVGGVSIRDRFYRLNLFCGSNLNAALVPLYRGPSLGGTQYGNATDTNNGPFVGVGTDYAETGASGGLAGNASTKYLKTGFIHNTLPQNDSHIASYEISRATAIYRTSVGCRANGSAGCFILGTWANTSQYALVGYESTSSLALSNSGGGFYVGTITGASMSALYRNATGKVTTTLTTRTPGSQEIFVFALNDGGSFSVPTDARLGGYSFGLQMSDAQVLAYNTAMQAFQTAMTRNV